MKRFLSIMTLAVMAAAALTGCKNPIDELGGADAEVGGNFIVELSTAVLTKTVADQENLGAVSFAVGDRINLFHTEFNEAAAYSSYVNDGCFTVTEIKGDRAVLKGYLAEDLNPDRKYDWFGMYPYSQETVNPENAVFEFPVSISCTAGDPLSSLAGPACPLAGEAKKVSVSEVPVLQMHQVATAVEVVVTNWTEDDIVVNTVEISSFIEEIAGKQVYDTHDFRTHDEDPDVLGYDEEYEEYAKCDPGPRFVKKQIAEGAKKVTLHTGGVTIESYDNASFFIPMAPTVFQNLGSNFAIKVNKIYKPVTMRSVRLYYTPQSGVADYRYLRHNFYQGQVNTFQFNYGFSDIENVPAEWTSANEAGEKGKQSSWFNNSANVLNFMGCSSTASAMPKDDDSFSKLSYIWLQSYGHVYTSPFNLHQMIHVWEDEGPVWVLPILHAAAGKSIVLETRMFGNASADITDDTGTHYNQGAPCYYMCEYSSDQGKTWKPAQVESTCAYSGPVNANFAFKNTGNDGSDPVKTPKLTLTATLDREISEETFLFRVRAVNATYSITDVMNGTAPQRSPLCFDFMGEPDTYGGNLAFRPFNGDEKYGIYARVSVK